MASLREGNRKRVIDALRERGVASRAELARITGLSRSTISTIVADLLDAGLAGERDGQPAGEVHAGRPPVMVSLNRSAGVALGIDFGHRHLRVAVSDLSHSVLAETWCELDVDHSATDGLDRAAEFVDRVLSESGTDRNHVIGAGMGLPAPIDRISGSVQESSILPGWVGVDAAGEASARLGLPVEVENDANLGALAEYAWGAAKGRADVVYIKVSSGIGAGLISRGKLQHGVSGTAGEIGHMVLSESGPVCRCGNRGCLETLASSRAVADLLAASRGERVSTRQLLDLCAAGDPAARRLVGDAGRAIGVAVANLCNILNPECVIVGGDLAAAGDALLDPLRDVVRRTAVPSAVAELEMVGGVLGDRAEMLGALALVMHESERFADAELVEEAA
ncbi:MAG TPA: ROK family transcriptional regulator [Solirubrobacterales bacterium]|nr:ROK family transcriptional regulator [Solirubrobacterales bacterium]